MPKSVTPRRYRSIWISDVHLGTKHAQVDQLLQFLRDTECDFLYLVGDIIDGWELGRNWLWNDSYNTLFQKILRKNRKQTRITYLTGNHDEFLEKFIGIRFGRMRLKRQAIHEAADGKRYLVVHGHQFDGLTHCNRYLERVGARLYNWILTMNHYVNRVRRRLGFGYWSFAAYLKFKAKTAVKFVTHYEEAMVQMARMNRVDGVICGHIHRAEIKKLGGIHYLNSGDWVESCTALVEDFSGEFSLIHFHENNVHRTGRGTGSHDPGTRSSRNTVPVGT